MKQSWFITLINNSATLKVCSKKHRNVLLSSLVQSPSNNGVRLIQKYNIYIYIYMIRYMSLQHMKVFASKMRLHLK